MFSLPNCYSVETTPREESVTLLDLLHSFMASIVPVFTGLHRRCMYLFVV